MAVKTVFGNCFVCNDCNNPVREFSDDKIDLICESCDCKYFRSCHPGKKWQPWQDGVLKSVATPEPASPEKIIRDTIVRSVQDRAS